MRLKKESTYIQGVCIICNINKQTSKEVDKKTGKKKFKNCCSSCQHKRNNKPLGTKKPWFKYKKDKCESCGFIPEHKCQLDVDHIDGDHNNNNPSNFKTLCANCHRLKTYLCKEWSLKYRP